MARRARRSLRQVRYMAGDRVRDQLFVLTDSLHAGWMDGSLTATWTSASPVPGLSGRDIEDVLAHDGVGVVALS